MPPKNPRTRLNSGVRGAPASLPDTGQLFVNQAIIADIKFRHQKLEDPKTAIVALANRVEGQFLKVNPALPLLSKPLIIQKIQRPLVADKEHKGRKMTKKRASNFVNSLPLLFDIISCKCNILPCTPVTSYLCPDVNTCSGFHVACSCPKDQRIPDPEAAFIKDQREKVGNLGGNLVMEKIYLKDVAASKITEAKLEKKKDEVTAFKRYMEKKVNESVVKKAKVTEEVKKATEEDYDEDQGLD